MNLLLLFALSLSAQTLESLRLEPLQAFSGASLQAAQESEKPAAFAAAPVSRPAPEEFDPLAELVYVAFDLETTGLYPEVDRIIEIGAVKFRLIPDAGIQELGRFQALVDPERTVPAFITRLTGIEPTQLAGKPKIGAVLADFNAFIADADALVAHNARFDATFIAAEAGRAGAKPPHQPVIDTLSLARSVEPGLPSYSLKTLAANLGAATGRHHRGVDDSAMCAGIFGVLERDLAYMRFQHPATASWTDLKSYQTPEIAQAAMSRVIPADDTPGPHKSLPAGSVEEAIEAARKELWALRKPNQLSDIARHMGVSYFALRDALAREVAAN